jgi:hypothetical protein
MLRIFMVLLRRGVIRDLTVWKNIGVAWGCI